MHEMDFAQRGGFGAGMHVEGPNPVVLAQHGEVSDVDLHWTGGITTPAPNNPHGSPIVVGAKVSREMPI